MNEFLTEPDGLEEINETISNSDGAKIREDMESLLKAGTHWVSHCAWDHWGAIWYAHGQFHERVMRYGAHIATISDQTLSGVVDEVNERFGRE